MLAIVDLGCGNLGSVRAGFERLGLAPVTTCDPGAIAAADRIVLPGVGAAGYAMARIHALGLAEVIQQLRQPLLGICLGMQLLFERSEEGGTACLGILPGTVRALKSARGLPVPHMGWNSLARAESGFGLDAGDHLYFAHSFACDASAATTAEVVYGRTIAALVASNNVWGAQFHPERSAEPGARFLKAWLSQ
ncbi:imidazole glycerol phosphate synthase subunit HisH [Allosphingosinicella indica]|uniref:Imidazole glycerol phosphate synthase subunit HisH n=1 Tax=Allosphingosinicella indica TaxID=941907 RepID=A0A1X7FYD5_9SPHN|nr:imidazole glycerol phosphate synthase subunit HisH [Allosphingosinicella indica]SMF61087.1 glutamine amidotransferase [Allosphingosinicella indica]